MVPLPDLAKPSDFLDPSKAPGRPVFQNTMPSTDKTDFAPDSQAVATSPSSSLGTQDDVFGARAVDQGMLEREVASKADLAILERANEDDQRRLDKALLEKEKLQYRLQVAEERYNLPTTPATQKRSLLDQLEELKQEITRQSDDVADISQRMSKRGREAETISQLQTLVDHQLPTESTREFLIRTGKITPFDNIPGVNRASTADAVDGDPATARFPGTVSAQNLRKPGFKNSPIDLTVDDVKDISDSTSALSSIEDDDYVDGGRRLKKRRICKEDELKHEKRATRVTVREQVISESPSEISGESDDDYYVGADVAVKSRKRKTASKAVEGEVSQKLDDGDERLYQDRLRGWSRSRKILREQHNPSLDQPHDEWRMPHPTIPDSVFSGDFKLPGDIHPSLFPYQKVGVQWLWELHCQNAGGILGDEMGLGKTIQVISFIAGLHYSGMLDKPCLVVAPCSLLKQWASEFHEWWPALRVAILHSSGSGMLLAKPDSDSDSLSERPIKRSKAGAKRIVDTVFKHGHILITTYEGLTTYGHILLNKQWEYAILDEGHKIRNPDANVSLNCKQLKTHHRVILSGTPIQNNLVELWSLFDFVFPGRLGTLPVFKEQFEVPIRLGGYKNASNIQVQTAMQCAMVLRQLIGPYLLRRLKMDVMKDLPPKDEKILFCKLTKGQVTRYKDYLKSPEVREILNGSRDSLAGISVLRKICCHPDLVDREQLEKKSGYNYGDGSHSGKMQVMKKMLSHWKKEGHRVLLFSQGVQVLDILEKNIRGYKGFEYRRMDGNTPIPLRQQLVDEFNNDPTIDVFLLTTRVGGLGVNLTGADRVIIFDPDWNPSVDTQARERAWRIGQLKPVSIFRLVSAGTIEEKMYNRQLFKQHLSQKVLSNSEQQRFFSSDSLHDLFTFGSTTGGTATGALFRGAETVYGKNTSREDAALRKMEGVASLQEHVLNGADPTNESGEKRFIEEIWSNSGVLSSLEHEQAVGAGSIDMTKLSSAEQYALQVADTAAKRLQESVRAAQSVSIGTVTWTGQNGSAGHPQRASASNLLGRFKNRAGGSQGGNSSVVRNNSAIGRVHSLHFQMLEFFRTNNGVVTTKQIGSWCSSVGINQRDRKRALEMKATLRKIASLNKLTHSWELTENFK